MSTDKEKKFGLPKAIKKEFILDIESAGGLNKLKINDLVAKKSETYGSFKRQLENFLNYLKGLDSVAYKQAKERILIGFVKTRNPTTIVLPSETSSKPSTSSTKLSIASNKPQFKMPSKFLCCCCWCRLSP